MLKKSPYKILFFLLVITIQPVFGQSDRNFSFENYSNREGFDQNTVWAIEQDKYGMFWLGTANGLIKYDGYSFEDISWNSEFQADIQHERIRDIITDNEGLIWILTRNALNIYDYPMDRFIRINADSVKNFNALYKADYGLVWVFGVGYLASVSKEPGTDSILTICTPNLFPAEFADVRINDMLRVNEGLYLLATSRGLYKMVLSGDTFIANFELDSILPETRVSRLLRVNDIIWIGTASGLHKTLLDGRKIRHLNSYTHTSDPTSIGGDDIRDLLLGPDEGIWIGTWGGGLSMFNNENETFTNYFFDPRKQDGISSPLVNCIYLDQFNVLWIGTSQGGLSKLDLEGKQFTNIKHNPYDERTIPGNLINSILEDSKGYLWISTYQNPLSRSTEPVNEQSITNLKFKRFDNWFNSFPAKNILSVYEDKNGFIWLGYENSVVVYDQTRDAFKEIKFGKDGDSEVVDLHNVNFIGEIDSKRVMLAGSRIIILNDPWQYFGSASQSTIPTHRLSATDDFYGYPVVAAEIEDPGKIWIGFRDNGLHQYSLKGDSIVLIQGYKHRIENETSISNNTIFSILSGSEDDLWVGTFGGGLNLMNKNNGRAVEKFDRLDTLNLGNDVIYGIMEENDSIMWLSTDLGIIKFNRRSLETIRYNMADGIASNNFRKNAYYKGHSGFYYFGGLLGLTLFKPDQIQTNLIPPETKLSGLRINNKRVAAGEQINKKYNLNKPIPEISELVLTRSDRTIALDVIVMHTATQGKNSFSYMLEGFDEEWMVVNQGSYTLNYTNLPSGKYILKIRGFNGDGIPSENETSLNITMLAPWYARLWSKIIFALFGLSVIIAVSIYIIKLQSLENKLHFEKIDKDRITEINKAKLRFFTNVSHEFRTPLALISIPLQKLREMVTDPEQKKYLADAEKNTGKLIRLIDQLLSFRKMEHGKMELIPSNTTMDDFLYPIAEAFDALSIKKEIEFHFYVKDSELTFAIDLEKMEQVLYNLLSNAFKFTSPGGKVTLEGKSSLIDNNKHVCFEIKDTGKGIPKRDRDRIFERFYQFEPELKNLGTGIGLSYSKSIVELHGGNIHVDSTPGTGTVISVLIPFKEIGPSELDEKVVRRIDPMQLFKFEELATSSSSQKQAIAELEGTILVVDDEVEFRNALQDVFKNKFRILEASNGREALEITRSEYPDLIISDVMMPVMNGYDFCKSIKTDIELCHIPFILLSALEEMGNHIQGLEFGADSYISKPFNLKYLEVSVIKLIENRRKIQEHFSRNHHFPNDINISGIDRVFIESVNEAILQNLDNSSFGVEELASKMNLSSSHFYRKLKSLTGQIPNAYIRNLRLQTAADLISNNPGISMKNVMFEVGFESASHFSHAFKKKFGLSPSEFSE